MTLATNSRLVPDSIRGNPSAPLLSCYSRTDNALDLPSHQRKASLILGVAVALGMKALRVEEKYVHPKIEVKIQGEDKAFDTVLDAIQKKNAGRADEAFVLLLDEAIKNPLRKDVVETLWDVGVEVGRAEESAKFFIPLIAKEVIELCLRNPEIPAEQKAKLQKELDDLNKKMETSSGPDRQSGVHR